MRLRYLSHLDAGSAGMSAFDYNEAQLRFHEGNAFTHLHETSAAWQLKTERCRYVGQRPARGAVSKIMKRIVDRNLIERSRTGRRVDLTLLREDGSGTKYERPLGETKFERWLQLPHAYWLERHYTDLSLPAKVILLIALSRDDGFAPQDGAPQWYGISADSADEGLRELVNKGLLNREYRWEVDSRSDTGWTKRCTYTPIGAFSKAERKKASASRRRQQDANLDLDEIEDAP